MAETEIWKYIEGYNNKYEVSNLGNVRSYNNARNGEPRLLKTRLSNRGYIIACLSKFNSQKIFSVHRLVAKAFILNIKYKPQVNHKNGVRTDNRVENLEWNTQSENMLHAFKFLGRKGSSTGKFGKDNPKSKKVDQYSRNGEFIKTWDSIMDITRELKINKGNIGSCCRGIYKTAGGFIWRFNKLNGGLNILNNF